MTNLNELRRVLNYDPDTGLFTWLVDKPRSTLLKAGRVTNALDAHGYVQINFKGNIMKGHRIAWLFMTGEMPNGQIDHINHIRHDNRWCNLRVVNNEENHKNRPMQKNNKSGMVGVCFDKTRGKYLATIYVEKKQKRLGFFDDIEDAKKARSEANKLYGYSDLHGVGYGRSKKSNL